MGFGVVRYLAGLTMPRLVLWCYFVWYLVVLTLCFDPSPRLWLTSLGLSVIIAVALLLNAGWGSPRGHGLDRWQVFRFFLTPFCVSSFAALIKGRGFVLVFSPHWRETAFGLAACAAFVAAARLARVATKRRIAPALESL